MQDAIKLASRVRSALPSHTPVEVDVVASITAEDGDILTIHLTGRPPFIKMDGVLNGEEWSAVGHPEMLPDD